MTTTLRFRVIGERKLLLNMEMSFFGMPYILLIVAPKIGMNRTGIVLSSSGCNSSRFSRPCTLSYLKGIQEKKTSPMLFSIEFLRRSRLP
jgi:hypothetical protein